MPPLFARWLAIYLRGKMASVKTNHKNSTCDEYRFTIYFPLEPLTNKTQYLYGLFKIENCSVYNVYILKFESAMQTNSPFQLLGRVSNNNDNPGEKNALDLWIDFRYQSNTVQLKTINIAERSVSFNNILLILYVQSLLQSEILKNNINWKNSKSLQDLSDIAKFPIPQKIPTTSRKIDKPDYQISNELKPIVEISQIVNQLHHRFTHLNWLRSAESEFEFYNMVFAIMIDILLGFIFLEFLYSVGGTSWVLQVFSTSFKVFRWILRFY